MRKVDIIKEDLDHIASDCRRIGKKVDNLWVYMNGLYSDAIITQGKFSSTDLLIKDLNKHWDSVKKLIGE